LATNFWDTSALAKLYLPERGSNWVIELSAHDVVISKLAIPEMASVFGRRMIEGSLNLDERDGLYRSFLLDVAGFEVFGISDALLTRASGLLLEGVGGTGLRALDAIQLASAQQWFERTQVNTMMSGAFVVADRRLRDAASAVGVPVDNPEEHE
jgi:predicted nucleic acid-binding protein